MTYPEQTAAPAAPGHDESVLVPSTVVRETVERILTRAGVPRQHAELQSDVLVEADLRGQHSHGVQRMPVIAGRLARGLASAQPEYRSSWSATAALDVDGGNGLGPVVAHRAIDELFGRVATTGVAVARISRAGHMGMLAPYVERIARTGRIGLALTTSEALVHPWGGARAMVGTNPIGIGVPTDDEPLVLDMSTAAVSMGKVLSHVYRGEEIPQGWAVDAEGRPTTDAAAAANGAISPFGGPKGYALGLAFEVLVASLTGTALGRDVTGTLDTEHPTTKGDVIVVLEPGLGHGIREATTRYLHDIRATATAPGVDGVVVPGDRARAERAHRLAHGIPLDGVVWQRLLQLASTPTDQGPDQHSDHLPVNHEEST